MSERADSRPIAIVSACMNRDGTPAFVLSEITVTQDEIDNGIHYYLAEADLMEQGYEEPFVHFDQFEAPPFLHSAVRDHLGLPSAITDPVVTILTEKL